MKLFHLTLVSFLFLFSSIPVYGQIRPPDISRSTTNVWVWRGTSNIGSGTAIDATTEGSFYVTNITELANSVYMTGLGGSGDKILYRNGATGQISIITLDATLGLTTGTLGVVNLAGDVTGPIGTNVVGGLEGYPFFGALGSGTNGYYWAWDNTNSRWDLTAPGTGSVTSVALSLPGVIFNATVPGSPVTSSGTLAPTLLTQTANTLFAGPTSGAAATPTFRSLVAADIPTAFPTATTSIGLNTIPKISNVGPPIAYSDSSVTDNGTLFNVQEGIFAKTVGVGDVSANALLEVGGTFTGTSLATGFRNVSNLTPTGTNTVYGMISAITANPNNTGSVMGDSIGMTVATPTGGTVANAYGEQVNTIAKTGTGTITNAYTMYLNPQSNATNNYTLFSSSGINYMEGFLGLDVAPALARLHVVDGMTNAAWGSNGIIIREDAGTITDSSSATGTVATNYVNAIGQPTLAASNTGVIYTSAATLYIANAPAAGSNVTNTNSYALRTGAGAVRFDGNVGISKAPSTALDVSGNGTFTGTVTAGTYAPMTTAGDLIIGGASGAATRLAIGANNTYLKSNGTTESWAASAGGAYARAVTYTVCASNSADVTNCDYIATGTDDQTTINNAITAASTTVGATVLMMDGTYNIGNGAAGTKDIVMASSTKVLLKGVNKDSVILKRGWNSSGTSDAGVIEVNSTTALGFSDFTIDGNSATDSNTQDYGIYTSVGMPANFNVDRVVIQASAGDAFHVAALSNEPTYITRCSFTSTAGVGFYNAGATVGLYFDNNYVNGNTFASEWIGNISNSSFTNNHIYNVYTFYCAGNFTNSSFIGNYLNPATGDNGFFCGSGTISYSSISDNNVNGGGRQFQLLGGNTVSITGNTFQSASIQSIYLSTATDFTITGNNIYSPSDTGIYITAGTNCVVTGNRIRDFNGGAGTAYGILVDGSSVNVTVTGNHISRTAGTGTSAGIDIASGATGVTIGSNALVGSGATSIIDAGTSTKWIGQFDGKHVINRFGTNVVSGDFTQSGFGTHATISVATDSVDQFGTVTVTTSTMDTPSMNPTITLTFHDGAFGNAPFLLSNMDSSSTGPLQSTFTHTTTTTGVFTYNGLPTAVSALTYVFTYQIQGGK